MLARELGLGQIRGIIGGIRSRKIAGPSGHPARVENTELHIGDRLYTVAAASPR